MRLTGGEWSKGDFFAALACLAGILAIPGMPKVFHWDRSAESVTHSQKLPVQAAVPNPVFEDHPVPAATESVKKIPQRPATLPALTPRALTKPTLPAPVMTLNQLPASPQLPTIAPAPITQNCPQGICAGGDIIGSPSITIGNPPPPKRVPNDAQLRAAFDILQKLPQGSNLELEVVGSGSETYTVADLVQRTFQNTFWTVRRGNTLGMYSMTYGTGDGRAFHSDGKGIVCSEFASQDPAAKAAIEAMSAMGLPCRLAPASNDYSSLQGRKNITITIGSRFLSPDDEEQ